MFAKVSGNTVLEWPIDNIATKFPNISFSTNLSNDNLPEGYVIVGVIPPPVAESGKKVVPGIPIKQDGFWVQSWDIVDMTEVEVQELNNSQASYTREKRDILLQKSDLSVLRAYEQGIPAPVELVEYRQQLRDITLQNGFPWQVEWPIKP